MTRPHYIYLTRINPATPLLAKCCYYSGIELTKSTCSILHYLRNSIETTDSISDLMCTAQTARET